jgi:hypothetical protein
MYAANKQQRWWPWALACAIIQGGPGVWALHMIAMCAMSWPAPEALAFNPSWALASLIVTMFINLLAFYASLYGWQRNKMLQDRSSSAQESGERSPNMGRRDRSPLPPPNGVDTIANIVGGGVTLEMNHNIGSTGLRGRATPGSAPPTATTSPHTKSRRYETGRITPLGAAAAATGATFATGAAVGAPSSGSSNGHAAANNDDGESTMISGKLRRRIREMSLDRSISGQLKVLPYRINIWFVLSALLLSATTLISHWMIGESLPLAYGAAAWQVPYILFFMFGTVAFLFAILMWFYFFPIASVRFMGTYARYHTTLMAVLINRLMILE